MGLGIGRGLVGLFKQWGKGIGNAADHVWLREEARKAIKDEVTQKFKPKIDIAHGAESKRAKNIKDLDAKLTQSKKDLAEAKANWQRDYDAALAGAKNQRQLDIDNYNTQSQAYQKALDDANANKQSIFNKLYDDEDNYDPSRTIFTDVNTGDRYLFNSATGQYSNLTKIYPTLTSQEKRKVNKAIQGFGDRLYDFKSGKAVNAFDDSDINTYANSKWFNEYHRNKISTQNSAIRNADNEIKQADDALKNWTTNNSQPKAWDDNVDLKPFKTAFNKNNAKPTSSFNGQNYSKESDLDQAYQEALAGEKRMQSLFHGSASRYSSKRDAEIAQRIQYAKDINKAKVLLGGTLGAGALYAAGKAMYGGDDTDNTNTNNTDNINNIDNTEYGNPDPKLKLENTPEGKTAYHAESIDTGFDPDKANAVATLAAASRDAGVEDSNSIESSDDHFIDDDELYGLLKAMEDPHKADAVANYIYSKHGNESDVQNLGWRGWLNKYYGDLLRSRMNLDPSSYKGMHISGGL